MSNRENNTFTCMCVCMWVSMKQYSSYRFAAPKAKKNAITMLLYLI